jgi:hypothetical protein
VDKGFLEKREKKRKYIFVGKKRIDIPEDFGRILQVLSINGAEKDKFGR